MPARGVMLPPLAPRTPEQRVEARLQRVVREPRGGVLLRSELVAQNEALARENEVLRTQLAQVEERRRECEAQIAKLRAESGRIKEEEETADLLSGEGARKVAAGEEETGPRTWPKAKGAAAASEEDETSVFEDVTLQDGGAAVLRAAGLAAVLRAAGLEADRKGYMFKKGKRKHDEFKKRWFELRGGQLAWFEDAGGKYKGEIDMASDECKQVRVSEAEGASQFEVEIVFGPRTYRLETENTDERRAWIHALQDARQGAAAAKLRQSQAGEDPPPTATEDGSLTDSTFFGAGSGAKSKLKLKRAVAATVVANRMVER